MDLFVLLALLQDGVTTGAIYLLLAIGLLIGFLTLSIQSYLATHTLGEFRLSFWGFGPTELRILLAVGSLVSLWKPEVRFFGEHTLFDAGGAIGLAGMSVVVIIFTAKNTVRLYRAERITK